MKIALLAPFEESVPPQKYGGTELIVYYLAQILSKKHDVFLLATGDSKTKAKLFPIFPRSIRKEKISQDMKFRDSLKYIGVAKIIQELKKINPDIISNHLGWRFLPFAPLFKAPVITTLHGPLNIPYQQFVYSRFKEFPFISISNSQRKHFPKLNFIATIYNGIDIKQFNFKERPKSDYFAFLARMSPEKGPLHAIKAAKKAKVKLKMAAKVDIVDKDYFFKKVKPLIDGKQIKFLGEIEQKEKSDFLGNAKALLCPLQWEEPFGLFMIEAMACGTPVIAFKRGSVPELIKHGKTGFICEPNDLNSMIKAINKIGNMSEKDYQKMRFLCRKNVEENFTAERMVSEYEKVFKEIKLFNYSRKEVWKLYR
jgi:glycosyltransferase involved in cell wall biosynthesis